MLKRKGFTLAEVMITIAVLSVLGAGIIIGADEVIATARAEVIIQNLQTLRKAIWAWYIDNKQNVAQRDGDFKGQKNIKAGMVAIDNKISPIQEWGDDKLKLSTYLSHLGATGINLNKKQTIEYSDGRSITSTSLKLGYYGVCDGGGTANKRYIWYVGYRFKKGEDAVKKKIAGKIKSLGLMFGTADAHENPYEDGTEAIWLKVLDLKS